jgi:hypothetical protein
MATNPPITIGELADVPAPGSGIKSAWSQEVTNRIVHRFATTAERDTKWPAATAGTGAFCVVGGVLFTVTGGAWVTVAAPRTGISLAGPQPSLPPGAYTTLTWSTVYFDSGGFRTSSSVNTIPVGKDGVYTVALYLLHSGSTGTSYSSLTVGPDRLDMASNGNGYFTNAAAGIPLVAGNTITAQVWNGLATAIVPTGKLHIHRISGLV